MQRSLSPWLTSALPAWTGNLELPNCSSVPQGILQPELILTTEVLQIHIYLFCIVDIKSGHLPPDSHNLLTLRQCLIGPELRYTSGYLISGRMICNCMSLNDLAQQLHVNVKQWREFRALPQGSRVSLHPPPPNIWNWPVKRFFCVCHPFLILWASLEGYNDWWFENWPEIKNPTD